MSKFNRGLVVGKFSPLHHGHELVIRRALDQCERVFVISYTKPEFQGCETSLREKWLAELFPSVHALVINEDRLHELAIPDFPDMPCNGDDESTHRRFVAALCLQVFGATVDAVFTSETYGDGFAADLTEYFRRRSNFESRVLHVLVDAERRQFPISGAELRKDVHANRRFLSPVVYTSFIKKVCILGGESSGKSTLCAELARRFETVQVPEYGRELWERKEGNLTFPDMLHIAQTQVRWEESACRKAVRFLFCDTSPLTTLFYSERLFGRADGALEQMAGREYDLVALCAPDFPFVQDGTRQHGSFREEQHEWYLEQLGRRHIPYALVRGDLEQRILQVSSLLVSGTK